MASKNRDLVENDEKEVSSDQPVIKVVLEGGDERYLPVRAHSNDVGMDLRVSAETLIRGNRFAIIPLGIDHIELPEGFWAIVAGRSSTWVHRKIIIDHGIIDPGYRGPILARAFNPNPVTVRLDEGERIAQLVLMPAVWPSVFSVEETTNSERGSNGLGSSGRS
jgi:dUTP pyrophosphatase